MAWAWYFVVLSFGLLRQATGVAALVPTEESPASTKIQGSRPGQVTTNFTNLAATGMDNITVSTDCGYGPMDKTTITINQELVGDDVLLALVSIECLEDTPYFPERYTDDSFVALAKYPYSDPLGHVQSCTLINGSLSEDSLTEMFYLALKLFWYEGSYTVMVIECEMVIPDYPASEPVSTTETPPTERPTTEPTGTKQVSSTRQQTTEPVSTTQMSSTERLTTEGIGSSHVSTEKPITIVTLRTNGVTLSTEGPVTKQVGAMAPDDLEYIVEIVPHCGNTFRDEEAWVEIITDLHLAAIAICKNGVVVPFNSTDTVNFFLPVIYDEANAGPGECVFKKRVNSRVYNIRIEVSWGEHDGFVHTPKKDYQMTCSFESHGTEETVVSSNTGRLIGPKVIHSHHGQTVPSVIDLNVVNVLDKPILSPVIRSGQQIRLTARSNGEAGELGIKPVSCDAVGTHSGKSYAILRAGCGDGVIFKQDTGFTTDSRTALSPYFKSFSVFGDSDITFQCNFTLCAIKCDGSSCVNDRRKRSSNTENMSSELKSATSSNNVLAKYHKVIHPAPGASQQDPSPTLNNTHNPRAVTQSNVDGTRISVSSQMDMYPKYNSEIVKDWILVTLCSMLLISLELNYFLFCRKSPGYIGVGTVY